MPKKNPNASSLTPQAAPIMDWPQAESVLGAISVLDAQARTLEAEADQRITALKADLKTRLDLIEADRAAAESALEAFVREHVADMLPAKSRKLRFGTVALRDEPKFSWPKTLATLIQRLREKKLTEYLVPADPAVDKRGIMAHWKKLPLADLGVTRKVAKDVFTITLLTEGEAP